jgi:hypothetical protein
LVSVLRCGRRSPPRACAGGRHTFIFRCQRCLRICGMYQDASERSATWGSIGPSFCIWEIHTASPEISVPVPVRTIGG